MLIALHRKLTMVNADREGWEDKVREHIDQGTNFLLILPKDPNAVKTFCKLFGLPNDCQPRILTQGAFFLMSQHVDHEAFDAVLHHWDDKHQIVFVEQIDFPMNRPPRLKTFIVYSPVLGIIAQQIHIREAKEALEYYQDSWAPGTPIPEAGLYHWERGQWRLYEGR
jgi:hypothetical protein